MKELDLNLMMFGRVGSRGVHGHKKVAACTILAQVIEGNYEVIRGNEKVIVERGCCFLAHEGDQLEIIHNGFPKMRARFLHFRFSLHNLLRIDQCYRFPLLLDKKLSKPFDEIFDYFENSENMKDTFSKLASDFKMGYYFLEKLLAIGSEESGLDLMRNNIERFLPMFKWLKQNINSKIEVEDMADYVNLSSSRLFKIFQDSFGISPMNYLKKIRLTEAQQLVISTDKTMEEISYLVGFNNPFHFSREFKKEYSMAPLIYRKQSSGI